MLKGFVVLVVIAMLCCAVAAYCIEPMPNALSAHAGMFVSTQGDKDSYFTFGANYKLSENLITESLVGLDYIAFDGTNSFALPLTYTMQTKSTQEIPFYYGGGAGVYFTHWNYSGIGSDSNTKFGLHAVAGYKFSENMSAEAKYLYGLDSDSIRGFGVYVNATF